MFLQQYDFNSIKNHALYLRKMCMCESKNIKELEIFYMKKGSKFLSVTFVLDFTGRSSVLLFSAGNESPNMKCMGANNFEIGVFQKKTYYVKIKLYRIFVV